MAIRVVVVITARPSYSRVKTVIKALKARPDVDLQIIAAASALVTRYGRVVDQIRADGFEVSAEIPSVVEGGSTRESAIGTGLLLTQMGAVLAGLKPDLVVTIADRHETLATATAASYQNIRLCHLLGGEVSGSIDDKVRDAITQLADVHCVATETAAQRVQAMNSGSEVHLTGCPSIDLAAEAVALGPLPGAQVVVLQHPVTDQADQAGSQMRETIKALAGLETLYFWPGEDAGNEAMSKELRLAGIHPVRNKPPLEFLRILMGSGCLVGNSSVGVRECTYLGVPVVDIGDRQKGRETAKSTCHVSHKADDIRMAAGLMTGRQYPHNRLYGDGHAGERIAAILAGKMAEAVA